jgi:hypothetical protein
MYSRRTLMRRAPFTLAQQMLLGINVCLAALLAKLFCVTAEQVELCFCASTFPPTQTILFRR